jgi:hypothetical protein
MEIHVERRQPLASEARHLPAATYNLARTLQARQGGALFVPIRAMQFLAIVDAEEFIFIDHQYKNWVEIAWQGFRPQARQSLDDAVAYTAVYYQPDGAETMRRLHAEFPKALAALADKAAAHRPGKVLDFAARRGDA